MIEIKYANYECRLNEALAKRQKVSDEQLRALSYLYFSLHRLLEDARSMNPDVDSIHLKSIARQIECLEYQLQENWNFPLSSNYHSYWYKIPHCKCPKLDNREMMGTDRRIYSHDCPIHGHSSIDAWRLLVDNSENG